MADRFWIGGTSTDHNVAANWGTSSGSGSPASVPGTGDKAIFDSGSTDECVLSANWNVGGIDQRDGFIRILDHNDFDTTITDGDDCIYAATAGIVDMGTGTLSVTGGTFDNKDVGTFTRGTSTLVNSGVCSVAGSTANDLHNWTVDSGATVTVLEPAGAAIEARNIYEISGTMILGTVQLGVNNADMRLNSGANISGGSIGLSDPSTGDGITVFNAGAVLDSPVIVRRPLSGATFAAGDYGGGMRVLVNNSTVSTLKLNSGSYSFNGGPGFELETTSTGTLTMDNSNNPNITVDGPLTIDTNAALITITDGATTDWISTADIINQVTGSGSFDWPQTAGNSLTAQGGASQFWDIPSISTIADVIVAKDALSVLSLNANLDCNSFTGETGKIDLGGLQLQTTELMDWQAGFEVIGLEGADVVVGGDFTADAQALISADPWTLPVSGTAIASGAGSVEKSDASGGTTIQASGWTDNLGNSNWAFVGGPFRVKRQTVYLPGSQRDKVYVPGSQRSKVTV